MCLLQLSIILICGGVMCAFMFAAAQASFSSGAHDHRDSRREGKQSDLAALTGSNRRPASLDLGGKAESANTFNHRRAFSNSSPRSSRGHSSGLRVPVAILTRINPKLVRRA